VESNDLDYAGFWRRAAAMLLDLVVLLPIVFLLNWLMPTGPLHPVVAVAPGIALTLFYSVYLVYRFGGTPGKLIMRLRITTTDGRPVTFARAFSRHLPELLLGTIGATGYALAAWRLGMPRLTIFDFPDREMLRQLQAAVPSWMRAIGVVQQLWTWSELIVLLTNRRRRALHDFIAGTVVIRLPRP